MAVDQKEEELQQEIEKPRDRGAMIYIESMAEQFSGYRRKKWYEEAFKCYRKAIRLQGKLTEEEKNIVFGIRGDKGEEILRGLFPDAEVIDVMEHHVFPNRQKKRSRPNRQPRNV